MRFYRIFPFAFALLSAATSPFLAGCVSTPLTLTSVGPEKLSHDWPGPGGFLKVFTATQTIDVDFQSYFHPHTGYDIRNSSGKLVQFVPNHDSNMDEAPDQVTLPPGNYNIVAWSTWCGQVTVPVVIEKGRTTVVHLDGNAWEPSHTASDQLVYLPNGETVGWSSLVSNSNK